MTEMEQPPLGKPADAAGLDRDVRKRLSRRHLLMGAAMLAVSGLTYARLPKRHYPAIDAKKYEALFPRDFGDWHALQAADLILPPESELANKLYEHILTRSYRNAEGDVVMFLAAYSSLQIDDVQVHRPEVCYSVAGFAIEKNQPYDLRIDSRTDVPARMVVARSPVRAETILYWTRVGDRYPADWRGQRLAMLTANLEGFYPDGILVRASVISGGKNDLDILTRFYRDLGAHVAPAGKRLLYTA